MLYDVKLTLDYEYDAPVSGGRHHVRVFPRTIPGVQRVIASTLTVTPGPSEHTEFTDFFGTRVTALAFRAPHDALEITMAARVDVERADNDIDLTPDLGTLYSDIAQCWNMGADAPHHFLGASPRIVIAPSVTAYARQSLHSARTAREIAMDVCLRINADFAYDGNATKVDTALAEAFELRRGVCQDFAHIMIAGLRGLGIPAGYVSGFLRTIPPKGRPRLEGADAMHAWVTVWCGREAGWIEFDPTNAMRAGQDHIVIGYGRDYADVSPIVGVLRSTGGHETSQAVDVLEVA